MSYLKANAAVTRAADGYSWGPMGNGFILKGEQNELTLEAILWNVLAKRHTKGIPQVVWHAMFNFALFLDLI